MSTFTFPSVARATCTSTSFLRLYLGLHVTTIRFSKSPGCIVHILVMFLPSSYMHIGWSDSPPSKYMLKMSALFRASNSHAICSSAAFGSSIGKLGRRGLYITRLVPNDLHVMLLMTSVCQSWHPTMPPAKNTDTSLSVVLYFNGAVIVFINHSLCCSLVCSLQNTGHLSQCCFCLFCNLDT